MFYSGDLKALDLSDNETSWTQISVLTEKLEISVPCSKVMAKLFKPCLLLRQILTENKVESYLHTIALPDSFINH